MKNKIYDAIIIGGGAAGMMAAIEAGKRERNVLVLEHNPSIGNKILISGGGRCNFTNINAKPENYISSNRHFMKSAFSAYTSNDFIELVEEYGIEYYEKKLGQLFCRKSSREIIEMLLNEAAKYNVSIHTNTKVTGVKMKDNIFEVASSMGVFISKKVVVACGGLSFPKKGATSLGYKIAEAFAHPIIKTRPGLVPLTLKKELLEDMTELSGISFDSQIRIGKTIFLENTLITHRGLSGPAILQISSYWDGQSEIAIRIEPSVDFNELIATNRNSTREVRSIVGEHISQRFADIICKKCNVAKPINQCTNKDLNKLVEELTNWQVLPNGTEGYEKAEVTIGGVDTNYLNQKTMESKLTEGLYFIGEIVDVTGWLGGYNFQWAWSSGFVCGKDI